MLLQLAAPAREAAQLADALAPVLQHPQLVGICVSLQRSIARLSTQARHALRLASVLAAAPVPSALLTTALAQQVRAASSNSVSQTQLAIDELLGVALAQRTDADHVVITPLVREGVLGCETAADLDAARDLIVSILAGELPQALAANRTNHYWSWIPHVLHIARTANPSSQLIEVNSWLARFHMLDTLCTGNRRAVILLEQGDLNNAQQLLDMELAARRMGLGEGHPNTVTPVNNLGVALSLRGEFSRARTMFEEAIAVRRKALGDNHTDLLTPLNNLGVVLWHEGEHAKARALFEKVVELRKGILGERHPETLVSMRNLAVALRHDGEFVAARSLLEHVIEVRRASLGTQHVDTCTAMASLAETLREHSEAILSRISETLSLDTPLLGHKPGMRVAKA
jgi:tetratricopeptide (TPR) repeat protein